MAPRARWPTWTAGAARTRPQARGGRARGGTDHAAWLHPQPKAPASRAATPSLHPFPTFPAYPEHGNQRRFLYELVVWFGLLLRSLWLHLPGWIRVIAAAVIVFNLIGWIFRHRDPEPPASKKEKSEILAEVSSVVAAAGTKVANQDHSQASAALENLVGTAAEFVQSGRPVTLVPFTGDTDQEENLAGDVFGKVCELLHKDGKPQWGLSPLPLKPDASDGEVIGRGQRMKSRFVLTAHVGVAAPGLPAGFTVRLFGGEPQ